MLQSGVESFRPVKKRSSSWVAVVDPTNWNTSCEEERIQDNKRITIWHVTKRTVDVVLKRSSQSSWRFGLPVSLHSISAKKPIRPTNDEVHGGTSVAFETVLHGREPFSAPYSHGDETWIPNYTPSSKSLSVEWKHISSPNTKKFKVTPYAEKMIATVFWERAGSYSWRFGEECI